MPRTPVARRLANAGRAMLAAPPALLVVVPVLLVAAVVVGLALAGGLGPGAVDFVQDYSLVLLVVPAAAAAGAGLWWRSRRRRAFRRLAEERGWRYTERSHSTLGPHPSRGDASPYASYASDLVEGSLSGYAVALFTYHSPGPGRRYGNPREVGVGVVRLPAALPRLEVVPEGVTELVAGQLTGPGVDIESAEFNRRYRVRLDASAEDETAARKYAVDVLNPRAVEALLATPAFAWQINSRRLIGTWRGTTDTGLLVARLDALVGVARHLPSFHAQEDR